MEKGCEGKKKKREIIRVDLRERLKNRESMRDLEKRERQQIRNRDRQVGLRFRKLVKH